MRLVNAKTSEAKLLYFFSYEALTEQMVFPLKYKYLCLIYSCHSQ